MERLFALCLLEDSAKYKREKLGFFSQTKTIFSAYEHLARKYKHVIDKFKIGSSLVSLNLILLKAIYRNQLHRAIKYWKYIWIRFKDPKCFKFSTVCKIY
jgi:hypothetical protein